MVEIGILKLNNDSKIPTKAHENDACYDCYCNINNDRHGINPHDTVSISLGFKMEIPNGYCALLFPRSGMSKQGINLANCVGVIDSNYKGEVKALIHNDSDMIKTIENHTRICQLMIIPILDINIKEITNEELTESERNEKGFGSSGVE